MHNELDIVFEQPIDMLIKHCRMFLYGSSASPELAINEVARDFYSFALMHLTCTMFLNVDNPKKDKTAGVFHRVLDPLGKSGLLRDIDDIFCKKVGDITLKAYLKERRNFLATHRTLSPHNLSVENQNITKNPHAIEQFFILVGELQTAVSELYDELIKLNKDQGNES